MEVDVGIQEILRAYLLFFSEWKMIICVFDNIGRLWSQQLFYISTSCVLFVCLRPSCKQGGGPKGTAAQGINKQAARDTGLFSPPFGPHKSDSL